MSRTAKPSPTADPSLLAVYDDHKGGEYGRLGGLDPPNDSFTGTNVVPYIDGGIGPRAGMTSVNPTGRANGIIHGFAHTAAGGGRDIWYQQGTAIRAFAFNGAITTYAGALAATPTEASDMTRQVSDTVQYIVNFGDKCYKLDHTAATVTALAGSPGGRAIALYGDRLMAGGTSGNPYRLYYSAAADPTSWPVTNFIDIGFGPSTGQSAIRGLYVMRDFLVIITRDLSTWVLTGVPGVNETVRRAATFEYAGSIFHPARAGIALDGALWTIGQYTTAPERFTGARWEAFDHLGTEYAAAAGSTGYWSFNLKQTATLPPDYGAIPLAEREDIAFVGNNRALIRRGGIWSKHEFGQTVVGFVASGSRGQLVLTDGGAVGAPPNFWVWNTGDDKPPVKAGGIGGLTSIGDASDTAPACSFSYPEWWADPGYEVVVRHVIVDYTEFNTGVVATADNNLTVGVTMHGVYEDTDVGSSTVSLTRTPAGDANVGSSRSKLFSFVPRMGRGFHVDLSAIRGFRIDRVSVIGDVTPTRVA